MMAIFEISNSHFGQICKKRKNGIFMIFLQHIVDCISIEFEGDQMSIYNSTKNERIGAYELY